MTDSGRYIEWNGDNDPRALNVLRKSGGVIVSPTKVGYIIMTTDAKGLDRKLISKIVLETSRVLYFVVRWIN